MRRLRAGLATSHSGGRGTRSGALRPLREELARLGQGLSPTSQETWTRGQKPPRRRASHPLGCTARQREYGRTRCPPNSRAAQRWLKLFEKRIPRDVPREANFACRHRARPGDLDEGGTTLPLFGMAATSTTIEKQRATRPALNPAMTTARMNGHPAATTAQVVTISSTLAPRDRSLIGLAKPCRNGPIAWAPPSHCVSL
jgi:hypothetical protein